MNSLTQQYINDEVRLFLYSVGFLKVLFQHSSFIKEESYMFKFAVPVVPTCEPELESLKKIAQKIPCVQMMYFDLKSLNDNFALTKRAICVLKDYYTGLLLHLPFREVFLTAIGGIVSATRKMIDLYPEWQQITIHPAPDVSREFIECFFKVKNRAGYIREDVIPTIKVIQSHQVPVVVENSNLWNAQGKWSLVGALPADLAMICDATESRICLDLCHALIAQEQSAELLRDRIKYPDCLRGKEEELERLSQEGIRAFLDLPIQHIHLAGYDFERGPFAGHGTVPKGQQLEEIRAFLKVILKKYSIPYILLEVREENYRQRKNLLAMLDLFSDLV